MVSCELKDFVRVNEMGSAWWQLSNKNSEFIVNRTLLWITIFRIFCARFYDDTCCYKYRHCYLCMRWRKHKKSIKVEHDSNVNKSLPISSDKFKTQFSDSRRTILLKKKLPAHKGTIQKWMFQDGENRNMNSRGIQKMKKHALSKIGKTNSIIESSPNQGTYIFDLPPGKGASHKQILFPSNSIQSLSTPWCATWTKNCTHTCLCHLVIIVVAVVVVAICRPTLHSIFQGFCAPGHANLQNSS